MAANLSSVCDYYANLLLLQYKLQPKARANIRIYVKQAVGDLLIQDIDTGFNLNNATGAQLDILGKYVGVPRNSGPPQALPYFGFWGYSITPSSNQNQNGMRLYANSAMNATAVYYRYSYSGTRNTDLTDNAYALLIRLKIILNSNNGTLASIQTYLRTFFPGLVALVDNKDMTLTYTVQEGSQIPMATLQAYLPKPMGVSINFVTMTAYLSTYSLSKTVYDYNPSARVDTDPNFSLVTVNNGVAPYYYSWVKLSSTITNAYTTGAGNPQAYASAFNRIAQLDTTDTSTWQCRVVDFRGIIATTPTLTVVLSYQRPP